MLSTHGTARTFLTMAMTMCGWLLQAAPGR
jgi:hypothetical protein